MLAARFSKLRAHSDSRILVVDDEEFCLSGLKAILKSVGVDVANRVDFAMSGDEAL